MPTEQQLANRAAWLAALRSGEYKQGPGNLKGHDGRHCCLGVACVVAGVKQVEGYEGSSRYGFIFPGSNNTGHVAIDWFEGQFGVRDYLGGERSLTGRCMTMNDEKGMSFVEIADELENSLFAKHTVE